MQIRFVCSAVLVGVLLGAGVHAVAATAQAAPAAQATEERRLVVIEAPGNVLTKAARERLHAAIAEVALRHGLAVASSKVLPEKLSACEFPGCLPPIAAASGALFVLRVEAKFAKESFKLVVELWNSDEGKLLGKDRRDCPICDEQDLWGSAALITQGLLERALREPAKSTAAVGASDGTSTAPVTSPTVPEVRSDTSGRLALYSGIALSVAGLATAVVGLYYMSVDGNSVSGQPGRVRDTRKYGVPMTVVGGIAVVSGLGLLTWHFWPGPTKVSVGPTGLQVAGRF